MEICDSDHNPRTSQTDRQTDGQTDTMQSQYRAMHIVHRAVKSTLTTDAAVIALVNALIISRIDYCNAVLAGVYGVHLRQIHGVLNAAARLIECKRKSVSISPTIRDVLRGCRFNIHVEYKLCTLVVFS